MVEYAVLVSDQFNGLRNLEDPVGIWYSFKFKTLQEAKECIRWCLRSEGDSVLEYTPASIKKSQIVLLAGNATNVWFCHLVLELSHCKLALSCSLSPEEALLEACHLGKCCLKSRWFPLSDMGRLRAQCIL